MSYTIAASVREGNLDCLPPCPEECIYQVDTPNGRLALPDHSKRTDCGACAFACPIEGADLNCWRPELQFRIPAGSRFDPLLRRVELPK